MLSGGGGGQCICTALDEALGKQNKNNAPSQFRRRPRLQTSQHKREVSRGRIEALTIGLSRLSDEAVSGERGRAVS
jgi:hypothetical protein